MASDMEIIEDGIEGTLKPIKLDYDEFYKILLDNPEGLILKIINIGTPFISQYQDKNNRSNKNKMAFYIDYEFKYKGITYNKGVSYALGYPLGSDIKGKYIINDIDLLRLLRLVIDDLDKYLKIRLTFNKIKEKLKDLEFIMLIESHTNKNNNTYYKLKPIELIKEV